MAEDDLQQKPEGRLIEAAAKASGLSVRKLAANAGMSDTRWRQIVKGHQPGPGGSPIPVHAPALTLARMAVAVGVTADQLAAAGRSDAGAIVTKIGSDDDGFDAVIVHTDGRMTLVQHKSQTPGQIDEIDLIYASTTMSAREKLVRIRQVLELRELAAQEAREQQEAPAPEGTEASAADQS